jgi:asparagine synthase (glutamine-hydrolysing)
MCGVALAYSTTGPLDSAAFEAMVDSLGHRGPDGRGVAYFQDGCVALGHRRLSIIDLSNAGSQPMADASNRFHIVFNGEIYNYKALRERLEGTGRVFQSRSDTEVLLNAFAEWGPDCLTMLDGIFAFAIYDAISGEVFLARDRFGVKPLYFTRPRGGLAVASEPKALLAGGLLQRSLRPEAVADFLLFGYVTEDLGVWEGLEKLPPGGWARLGRNGWRSGLYAHEPPEADAPSDGSIRQKFEHSLLQSVEAQNVADVEVGLFLSGGLDSSAVAVAQSRLGRPLRAFTVHFAEKPNNEVHSARLLADSLGLPLEVCHVEAGDLALLEDLQQVFDEPFADLSLLPTFLLSRFVRQQGVTVALSGDGGDEMLGGYVWYDLCRNALKDARPEEERAIVRKMYALYPYAFFLGDAYDDLFEPDFRGLREERAKAFFSRYAPRRNGPLVALQRLDRATYLPGDILTKVDRASMASGLEVRVPLLGSTVAECVLAAHPDDYAQPGAAKSLLRDFLLGTAPDEILNKKKQGFSLPIRPYLRSVDYRSCIMDSGLERLGFMSRKSIENTLDLDFDTNVTRSLLLYVLALWSNTWLRR